ncbi:hypothetical protein EWB00_008273 [Schistosoma japonicum]|uniref:Uncharacterized protein n=1 Tax=Schistosoma japonicum TaxID=6182 RepID=A0A4Z2CQV1_SCHJA|nr:hypothetical protein EWB00_008273 [Schistosoma japonicum]
MSFITRFKIFDSLQSGQQPSSKKWNNKELITIKEYVSHDAGLICAMSFITRFKIFDSLQSGQQPSSV